MSDIFLNLDTAFLPSSKRNSEGSQKHQRFIRRRRFLERKGYLKQKQLPAQSAPPKKRHKDGAGKVGSATWAEGSTQWKKLLPKGKTHQDSSAPARPPSGAASSASSARHNGTHADHGATNLQKPVLLNEYSSGLSSALPSKMVAIDCEMVGTGLGGRNNDLARCSIVSYDGDVMYDKYIRPPCPITNYRTKWSGIRRCHMVNAVPFAAAQKEILRILSGKIVIGHAVHNDFKALKYFHPKSQTRDTSKIPLLNRKAGFPETKSASLKRLTKQLLQRDIQVGSSGHSSVEDAQATMELYKVIEVEWERHLSSSPPQD